MNWIQLRLKLRKEFGNQFGFYNDKYRSGIRRVKIYGMDLNELKQFILKQDSSLNVNDYNWLRRGRPVNVITIHFSE
jgi:hypothetical protein